MNKITLITGAGRGIGYGIAKKFAENKNDLILIIRKKKQLKKLLELGKKNKVNVKVIIGDLKNNRFIDKLNKLSRVDNLINNASGENTKYFTSVTTKDLKDMIDVNRLLCLELVKYLQKK